MSEDLDIQHIGETEWQLFIKIKDHTAPTNNTVFSHIETCSYCQNCENVYNYFEIIKFGKTHSNVLAFEALLIKNTNLY